MAQKTTETTKRRTRKAPSVEPSVIVESLQDSVPVNGAPVSNLQEEIRRRAYELYLQRGGMPGNESQDWLIAEKEVRSRQMEHAH